MILLAGGCDRKYPGYWESLTRVVSSEYEHVRLLSCMFSQEKSARKDRHQLFDEIFVKYFGPDTIVEHADEESFYDQISTANVIYLHGGRTELLKQAVSDITRFRQAIKGKIVIGSSAGANFLSTACYSPSQEKVMQGCGILQVGVVVHYGVSEFESKTYTSHFWRNAANDVSKSLDKKYPLILLPEGTFAVFDNEDH